ncbi:MAG TPA: DinB family protein [Chryseosolibacter sp.]|nr:DinB family protein [Chryseosolibacter sp.]
MNRKLAAIFSRAEATRRKMLGYVSNLPEEKFLFQPRGKWSASQIISHLVHAESLSLQYMKKKSLGIKDIDETAFLDSIKFLGLKISQRIPLLKFKAPEVLGQDPPQLLFAEVKRRWDDERLRLEDFLYVIEDHELKKKIYKHPVAGKLNVIQAVSFFNEHCIHHMPQIRKLAKS